MKLDPSYKDWLTELKGRIRSVQIKAALAVNSTLIEFYWDLGKRISEKQTSWGSKFIEQLSSDLKKEFPKMQGFSRSNLFHISKFYQFYSENEIVQQPVGQLLNPIITKIPWGHHILIVTKSKDVKEAIFYIQQTIANGWNRETLSSQVKSDLYRRQGKAITNFEQLLPSVTSDLANQILKDPYNFDFLTLTENY